MRFQTKCKLCLLPSFLGIAVFFIIPYVRVIYFSLIESQFKKKFVGLHNYIEVIQNEYFRLAFKNTLLLIFICVPILVVLAILFSLCIVYSAKVLNKTRVAFILPLVVPAASVINIWQSIFTNVDSVLPIYLLFIWKNVGILIIILTAALATIDKEIFEAAELDGASNFKMHRYISIPIISPAVFFAILLAIVNSFRIFKDSYLYYGSNYPPDYSYTLQYYMNNHFLKLNYQSLSVGAILTSVLVLIIVLIGIKLQRRFSYEV